LHLGVVRVEFLRSARDEEGFIDAAHADQQVDVAEDRFGAVRAKGVGLLESELRLADITLLLRRVCGGGADAIVINTGNRAAEF
jgi:hypothetical protein